MGQDVSSEVAGLISSSKVFGSSENIRHGKYRFLIQRISAELIENDSGNHRMAFWEFKVLKSESNPQFEGDHVDYPGVAGPLKDDGTHPNEVNSACALKVDFDGAGGRSAGSNIKAAILGLFNKRDGEISDKEINKTWKDLALQKDINIGDPIGIENGVVVTAPKAARANPACGMIIDCVTMVKKKKKANEKGAFVTKLIWSQPFPLGTGENTAELVEKRRQEIETSLPDDDEETVSAPAAGAGAPNIAASISPPPAAPQAPSAPVVPPPAPPAPPVPPVAFVPPAPWRPHPTTPVDAQGIKWFFDGAATVKSEAQLLSGQ